MADSILMAGLQRAIAKAALAKHLETCSRCEKGSDCKVADAHRRMANTQDGPQRPTSGEGHVLTEYGTTNCPVEGVRANVDDGECSACGATVEDGPQ